MAVLELPLAVAGLMPQADRMLLLDELTVWTPGAGAGRTEIRPGHLFLDATGRLDAAASVESLAQLAAAVKGYEIKREGGAVRFGYLVGLKNFRFEGEIRAGDTLTLESRRVFEMEAVSIIEGAILRGAERLASGTLKLYEADALPPHPRRPPSDRRNVMDDSRTRGLHPSERSPIHRALIERLSDFSRQPAALQAGGDLIASGSFLLDDAFIGFDGHFPDYPIQPGVVTLEMGLVLAEIAVGQPLEFRSIETTKFLHPAYPNEEIVAEVRITGEENDGAWRGSAKIRRDQEPIATFSFQAGRRSFENEETGIAKS